ncbi:MAG: DUF7453 family protein [Planctomycetota bacterium]
MADTQTIAVSGQLTQNGRISLVTEPYINEQGQVAFFSVLVNTAGGDTDNRVIFRGDGINPLVEIARKGQPEPEGDGFFENFHGSYFSINDSGLVSFNAFLAGTDGGGADNTGVYGGDGSEIFRYAREGDELWQIEGNFGSLFLDFHSLSNSGHVVFVNTITGSTAGELNDEALVSVDPHGNDTYLAGEGRLAPNGNGSISVIKPGSVSINPYSTVVFSADLIDTMNLWVDDGAIFQANGISLQTITRESDAVPGGDGEFHYYYDALAINDGLDIAFKAGLRYTEGEVHDFDGIYKYTSRTGDIQEIIRLGDITPDGQAVYRSCFVTSMNNSGQVLFFSTTERSQSGPSAEPGAFLTVGSGIRELIRHGNPAPDGNGVVENAYGVGLNNAGVAVLFASIRDPVGGSADAEAIYLSNGIDTVKVVRTADTLAGRTVAEVLTRYSPDQGGHAVINDWGQVAFQANFTDGYQGVFVFTPELHVRSNYENRWFSQSTWTLGILPDKVHDVFIDPDASITLVGPFEDTTVKSLTLGGGYGQATLELQYGSTIKVLNESFTITPTGVLTGDGIIDGAIQNEGVIRPVNLTILPPELLFNTGLIEGNGRLDALIFSHETGEIRAGAGQELTLVRGAINHARIENIGGAIRTDQTLFNEADGLVTGRNAVYRFYGSLHNHGRFALSFGISDIFGDINNHPGAKIILTGSSQTTFYDDLTNNGSVQVTEGSTAVFLGDVTGAGPITGTGAVYFEGDVFPGSSPGAVPIAGDVNFGPGSTLNIELGGLIPGTQHDQLNVAGDLTLHGGLVPTLIDGYVPGVLDSFTIATFGALTGDFTTIENQQLANGLLLIPDIQPTQYDLIAAIPGDFTLDGAVGVPDLIRWAENFGATDATFQLGDANLDTATGVPDLIAWAENFGKNAADFPSTLATIASATAIPEPSGLLVLMVGVMVLGRRRST